MTSSEILKDSDILNVTETQVPEVPEHLSAEEINELLFREIHNRIMEQSIEHLHCSDSGYSGDDGSSDSDSSTCSSSCNSSSTEENTVENTENISTADIEKLRREYENNLSSSDVGHSKE